MDMGVRRLIRKRGLSKESCISAIHCNCTHLNATMGALQIKNPHSPLKQVLRMFLVRRFSLTMSLLCCSGILVAWWAAYGEQSSLAAAIDESTKTDTEDTKATFFREKVMPLLESRCFECHGPKSAAKGELKLTSRKTMLAGGETGPAVIPGKPAESLLMQAVRYEALEMPPRSRMPDEEIEILSQWIADGAVWSDDGPPETVEKPKNVFPLEERIATHWAWKKIERPAVPAVKQAEWPASDTDRFLLAKMEEAGIAPAPDADRRALLRRLYFDLIGLPPTIEQQDRFFSDPANTPVAMEKVTDELLASPQFGERWARHWLDLMRYAETLGHEFDYPLPYAWQYRDYVIRALNADVPYNQFVREHIAGDLMTEPRRNPEVGFNESIIATGFWYLCEDKHAPVDVKAEEAARIDNQIDVFGRTFLGLTIACARCHDHKFDAITADDYYALSGFLQSSRRRVDWIDAHDETAKLLAQLQAHRADTARATKLGLEPLTADVREKLLLRAIGEDVAGDENLLTEDRVARLKEILLDPKTKDLSHALSLFATLLQKQPEVSDGDVVNAWHMAQSEAAKIVEAEVQASIVNVPATTRGNQTLIFANLRDGLPQDWLSYGAAFRDDPAASLDLLDWLQLGAVQTAAGNGGSVTSANLSPKLRGELHSPEFELTHPEIHILAAGKGTRVRLVIDGYVMNEFSELLFSGCRQPIDTDGEFRWIRIAGDVQRYLGHRCHLEFLDDGDGWFAVREVKFVAKSNEASRTRPEIARTNKILNVGNEHSRKQLARAWAQAAASDPEWMDLAVRLRLLPTDQQVVLDHATAAWMKAAELPQPGNPVLVMCDGSGEDEYIFIRGNHNNHGPTATRHMLTALDGGAGLQDTLGSGRMELVDRLFADSNPFPSRVAVNRVWQHLFGRGIVASSDNFGVLGEAPTHPELLDLLADDFRNDGWSLKRLIKRLVLTRAYRLSSQRNAWAEQLDPTNRLLHRFSIRRLEGEVIRDEILSISGQLDKTMYGVSVPLYLSNFMEGRGRPGSSGPLDGAGRRSIYQSVNRNFLNPFMLTFDTPQPATAISRRSVSNVPAQALILMNNELVHQQASVWAKHLLQAGQQNDPDIIKLAYRSAFAREPSETELASLLEFARADAANTPDATNLLQHETSLTNLCHVLLNQKELLFLE